MNVEVAVLGSPSLIVRTVSVDVQHDIELEPAGLSVSHGKSVQFSEFRTCVKVEVAVLGFPS